MGIAEDLLQRAESCFLLALERNQNDNKALGNLGNTRLARGELKKVLLEEMRQQSDSGFGSEDVETRDLQISQSR